MPKKKAPEEGAKKVINPNVMGLRPEVLEQPITETLEINYMPYAMSVIVSRASRRSTGSSPPTASCFTPCTRCTCWGAPAPRAPTWWARP